MRAGRQPTARETFDLYDTNRDGVLDQREIAAMIDAIGYEVDSSYVGGVMGIFGQFDGDGNGSIDMTEFQSLWEHLGGAPFAPAAAPAPARSPVASMFNTRSTSPLVTQSAQTAVAQSSVAVAQSQAGVSRYTAAVPGPASSVSAAPVPVEDLAREEERAAVAIQSRVRGRSARKSSRGRPVVRRSKSRAEPPSALASQQVAGASSSSSSSSSASLSDADKQAILDKLHTVRHEMQTDDPRSQAMVVPSAQTRHPKEGHPVVVTDETSVHFGKVGRLVSETPSRQFAIVQFEGEDKTCPVKTESLRDHSGSPISGAGSAADTYGSRRMLTDSTRQGRQVDTAALAQVSEGDAVEVTDPTSAFFGQVGQIVSTTPSKEFLCVRFDGEEKPRPLRAEAVRLLLQRESSYSTREKFAERSRKMR